MFWVSFGRDANLVLSFIRIGCWLFQLLFLKAKCSLLYILERVYFLLGSFVLFLLSLVNAFIQIFNSDVFVLLFLKFIEILLLAKKWFAILCLSILKDCRFLWHRNRRPGLKQVWNFRDFRKFAVICSHWLCRFTCDPGKIRQVGYQWLSWFYAFTACIIFFNSFGWLYIK